MGGSPGRLSEHSPWSLCADLLGAEIDPCVFNTHFWDQKKIITPVIIRIVKQRQSRMAVNLLRYIHSLSTLPLSLYFWAYMNRHPWQGEVMESLLCSCSTPLFLTSIHSCTGAGGICALCTFLGSKYIVHFIQAATTLKYWCAPKSVLFVLGESAFCFGLCFCFSWSCMTLHSFSKDKITDAALWRLRGLVHGDTVVLLMDKKGDFCELNLHAKWMYITVF